MGLSTGLLTAFSSGRVPNFPSHMRRIALQYLKHWKPPPGTHSAKNESTFPRPEIPKSPRVWDQRLEDTVISTLCRPKAQQLLFAAPISMRHISTLIRCQSPLVRTTAANNVPLLARSSQKLDAGAFSKAVGARRFEYTDSKGVAHFRARGFRGAYEDPNRRRNLMVVVGLAGGAFSIFYVSHLEEVPYTHRKHFVAISPATERALGEQQFQQIKAEFKPDILPNNHPVTRKVHKVVSQIIDAAYPGVSFPPENKRNADGELILDSAPTLEKETAKHRGKKLVPIPGEGHMPEGADDVMNSQRHSEELHGVDREMMNEGVHGAPDKGGGGGYTTHLEGLNWEVIVVNKDILNAFCLPGGKIVVFTGLIKQFPTTDELATVLGHEVGHAVARHHGEKVSSGVVLSILELVVYAAGVPIEIVVPATQSLLTLPNSRKLESEADKIGLMLMAAGGFEPRAAPGFYAKMAELEGTPEYFQYLSTHPAGQQRARALAQAKVMQEAVQVYERTLEQRTQPGGFSWAF